MQSVAAVKEHPVEMLFEAMRTVEPYPTGVVPFPARLTGTGFFPGGSGLWGTQPGRVLPPMPIGGIMVLGHDFHSEAAFARTLEHGSEVDASATSARFRRVPTWTALLALFKETGVSPTQCFFTNAYMGLRAGTATTGRFPGSRDRSFVERCQAFFRMQLEAQQPRVIMTLGAWVPAFLAPLSEELADWSRVSSLSVLDSLGAVRHRAHFGASIARCSVVALTHPSLRGPNVGRRRYRDLKGHDAEVAMIGDALGASSSR